MRVLAAVALLVAWSCYTRAHQNITSQHLLSLLGVKAHSPVKRLYECGRQLGPSKCLSALSVWRAEKAINGMVSRNGANITEDVKGFRWERFNESTNEELYSQLCEGTEKLLQHNDLKLSVFPGYDLKLASNGDGKLNVDVIRTTPTETARSKTKKFQKMFYNAVPFLLVPGLIMSAILPFVLPMLKMMTMSVGMINNMALSGAVFTLLRNNAFNDKYEKKVVYVNEGYKNERHPPIYFDDHHNPEYSNNFFSVVNQHGTGDHFGDDEELDEDVAVNPNLAQYYGHKSDKFNIHGEQAKKENINNEILYKNKNNYRTIKTEPEQL